MERVNLSQLEHTRPQKILKYSTLQNLRPRTHQLGTTKIDTLSNNLRFRTEKLRGSGGILTHRVNIFDLIQKYFMVPGNFFVANLNVFFQALFSLQEGGGV